MKNILQSKSRLLSLIFFLVILSFSLKAIIDPDLGIHLGIGKYILTQKTIPQQDIFSFSQPAFPYVYHSWLTGLLVFLVYSKFGLYGVTLFYGLIFSLAIYFIVLSIKPDLKQYSSIYSLVFLIPIIIWAISLRTQLVTLLGMTVVYWIYKRRNKIQYRQLLLVPVLFFFWANMHGGFLLGLLMLGILFLTEFVSLLSSHSEKVIKRKQIFQDLSVLILSSLAVLINPYLQRIYIDTLLVATHVFISQINLDWMPMILSDRESFIFAGLTYIGLLLVIQNKLVDKKEKIATAIFFLLALKSRHLIIPFLVFLIPNLLLLVDEFISLKKKQDVASKFPLYVACISLVIAYSLFKTEEIIKMIYAYSDGNYYATGLSSRIKYPYGAVVHMKDHGVPQRLLNEFNWGGYLIWNFPKEKFFIDGRMDGFIFHGRSFLETYWQMINLEPGWQELMEKYQIEAVLAPTQKPNTWPLVEYLKLQKNWQVAYEDEISVLLVKKV